MKMQSEVDASQLRIFLNIYIQAQKIPIREVFVVVMVDMEVKRSDVYFCENGYLFVCTTV